MGLFSGGLIFGRFFVHQIPGLIFGWAYFREITVYKILKCEIKTIWRPLIDTFNERMPPTGTD